VRPTKPESEGERGRLAAGGGGGSGWRGPQSARLVPYWQFRYSAPGLPAPAEGASGADASNTESEEVRGVLPRVVGGSDGSGLEGGGGVM